MRTIKHLCVNIQGLLNNHKGKKIDGMIRDDNGKLLSDAGARRELARLQALGHKVIACCECEGFDPFGGGCPGRLIEDDKEVSFKERRFQNATKLL